MIGAGALEDGPPQLLRPLDSDAGPPATIGVRSGPLTAKRDDIANHSPRRGGTRGPAARVE